MLGSKKRKERGALPPISLLLLVVLALAWSAAAGAGQAERLVYAGGTSIVAISESEGRVVSEIPVGRRVRDLVVDGIAGRIYAAHSGGVEVFDTVRLQSLGRLSTDPAKRLWLGADHKTLYVLSHPVHPTSDGREVAGEFGIEQLDLASGRLKSRVALGFNVLDAVVSEASGRVYSLERMSRELAVKGLLDGRELGRLAVDGEPDPMRVNLLYLMSASPDGRYVYVPQLGERARVHVVETASGKSRAVVLEDASRVRSSAVSPDGGTLYLLTATELLTVDPEKGVVTGSAPLERVYLELAVSGDGSRLYLSNPVYGDGGSLAIHDAGSLGELAHVAASGLSLYTAAD